MTNQKQNSNASQPPFALSPVSKQALNSAAQPRNSPAKAGNNRRKSKVYSFVVPLSSVTMVCVERLLIINGCFVVFVNQQCNSNENRCSSIRQFGKWKEGADR
jgi:hypothetical protein